MNVWPGVRDWYMEQRLPLAKLREDAWTTARRYVADPAVVSSTIGLPMRRKPTVLTSLPPAPPAKPLEEEPFEPEPSISFPLAVSGRGGAESLAHAAGADGNRAALHPLGMDSLLSPAAVFDAYTSSTGSNLRRHLESFFEVVGAPGELLSGEPAVGDVLIRRALGEGTLAHVAVVARPGAYSDHELAAAGVEALEPSHGGSYVRVAEAEAAPARRLTNTAGRLGRDQLILRPLVEQVMPVEQSDDELVSWCHPYAASPLIGQIYFATNGANLGADDRAALQRLTAAFNEFGDRFVNDPIAISFMGHADPRSTTFPGGNKALSEDRAGACLDLFKSNLSTAARQSVVVDSVGKDADPTLARALQARGLDRPGLEKRMRMTAIMRPPLRGIPQEPIVRPRAPIPPKSREDALDRCRRVLASFAGMFTSEERRHLSQVCKNESVRDAFLNGSDPELQKISFGFGGKMTAADAETFASRFTARGELMAPFSTGPNADDLDVVGALKGLHSRVESGIDVLVLGAAHEGVTGVVNPRRSQLMEFVNREKQKVTSIYYRWN